MAVYRIFDQRVRQQLKEVWDCLESKFQSVEELEATVEYYFRNVHLGERAARYLRLIANMTRDKEFPGVTTICTRELAKQANQCAKTARRAIKDLIELNILKKIDRKRPKGSRGGQGSNIYVIVPVNQSDHPPVHPEMSTREEDEIPHEIRDQEASQGGEYGSSDWDDRSIKNLRTEELLDDDVLLDESFTSDIVPEYFKEMSKHWADGQAITSLYRTAIIATKQVAGRYYKDYLNDRYIVVSAYKQAVRAWKANEIRSKTFDAFQGYFFGVIRAKTALAAYALLRDYEFATSKKGQELSQRLHCLAMRSRTVARVLAGRFGDYLAV